MRIGKTVFFTGVFLFLITMSSYGADIAKIGVVDFQKILKVSNAGKKAMGELNKKGKEFETDLEKRGKEIETIKEKLDREAMVMDKEMRAEKERDFRIRLNDFRTLEKKYANELRSLNGRLTQRIQKDIFDLADKMGKKEGYLLIIERNEAGVVYFPNTIDITDKLIQQYNVEFSREADSKTDAEKKQ